MTDVLTDDRRRDFLRSAAVAGAALVLSGCSGGAQTGQRDADKTGALVLLQHYVDLEPRPNVPPVITAHES